MRNTTNPDNDAVRSRVLGDQCRFEHLVQGTSKQPCREGASDTLHYADARGINFLIQEYNGLAGEDRSMRWRYDPKHGMAQLGFPREAA